MKSLNSIIENAKNKNKKIAVANGLDLEVLQALRDATDDKMVTPIILGEKNKIIALCNENNILTDGFEFIEESDGEKTPAICASLIQKGDADLMMKGLVNTSTFVKAALDKEKELMQGKLISHIALFEIPAYHKLLGVTDAAINITPNLEQKKSIIENSVDILNSIGINSPKVACVAAVEKVNPKMQATIDAAELSNTKIKDSIIAGPMGFDLAVSQKACEIKGYKNEVGGDADLIIAPNIETGNAIYKTLATLGNCRVAAILIGTKMPLVLTSRADSHETKVLSIAFGVASL